MSRKGISMPSDRGLLTLTVLALAAVGVAAVAGVGPLSAADEPEQQNMQDWNEYKDLVGLQFPAQTSGEQVVMIKDSVNAENYGSADVATVGADSDEDDTTELFASEDVTEGEDYFTYSTFNSQITTNLPNSGDYKVAVIGTGIANEYMDYTVPDQVSQFRVEQGNPLKVYEKSPKAYATDSDVVATDTRVEDGSSTVALSNDFSSASDSDVDGTVTGVREYEVNNDKVAQFGEVSVSSVNDSVEEITVTVMVDGEQQVSETDADFSDNEGLDDGVEFGAVDASDSITVETDIEFADSEITSATALATTELDDVDDDSSSDDGSFGISALSTTWTGY